VIFKSKLHDLVPPVKTTTPLLEGWDWAVMGGELFLDDYLMYEIKTSMQRTEYTDPV